MSETVLLASGGEQGDDVGLKSDEASAPPGATSFSE